MAGLAVAAWTSRLLTAFVPPTPLPIAPDTGLSPTVFLFGVALALATTVLFGLVPALQTSRPDLVPSLKETLGAIGGRRRAWVRRALVVTQVSLSLVLLIGAGLFIRTMQNASRVDAGFDMPHGLLASIDLLPGGYDRARGTELFKTLLDRVRAVPGVEDASLGQDVPLNRPASSDSPRRLRATSPPRARRSRSTTTASRRATSRRSASRS